jgi:translocator protein
MSSPSVGTTRSLRLRAWLVAATGAATVAGLGSLGTDLGPWYQGLRQPPWKPPDLWFGPAWTLIFALTAWAAVRAWLAEGNGVARRRLLLAFGANAVLNVLWSWLFFRWRRPDWALAEVIVFWLSIVALILVVRRSDRGAAWLLAPYLVWVTFAATLNSAVVRLNGL